MTQHEKTGLMYTKYTASYYSTYLLDCLRYQSSVNCTSCSMKCCINGSKFIGLLISLTKLFKFEIQKCGQIFVYISPIFSCWVTYVECAVVVVLLAKYP